MKKKGQIAFVGGIITSVIALLLVAYLLIPQAKSMTDLTSQTDTLNAHIQGGNDTRTSLTQDATIGSVSVAGLTVTNNYTMNYTDNVLTILNATENGTYQATYTYSGTQYLSTAGQRTLAGVIVLAGIIGLLYVVFRIFGLA